MEPRQLGDLFSPDALAALRSRPDYDDCLDGLARGSLRVFEETDDIGRWMFRDLGRGTLYLLMVFLDGGERGVTPSGLAAAAQSGQVASRGRVMAFVRRAEAAGEIASSPGTRNWTQRRLILTPGFVDRLRDGNLVYAQMAARLAPDVAHLVGRMTEDAFFRGFVSGVVIASQVAALAGTNADGGEHLFLDRDRGTSILFDLMISQPRPRARLLEQAKISRARLSRLFDVSRAHINRLLADAAALNLLDCPETDRVVFSAVLSDDVERMMATTLQITRAALLIASEAAPPA